MTRIKKRRSGKNKTSDQLKSAAGKRRARKAEKAPSTPKEGDATNEPAAKKTLPYKKKFTAQVGGRRGGRAAASAFKEQHVKDDTTEKKSGPHKKTEPGKSTGKTRSAGSRRVAVAKSVATSFKGNNNNKKTTTPAKETTGEKKPTKGFAPWNKNKFKRKG